MQIYPAVLPNPLFGELAWGFVLIIIYVFARIAGEGEGRYTGCKKALSFGIVAMIDLALQWYRLRK
jgi:hypothetical protein